VYRSVNGGTNWTNITDASLNNEWPTNIAHQLGSNGALYVGTRRAVYYRSDAAPAWSLWNAGLPARIFSTRMLINYREGKIRNATDRSVWESAVESPSAPLANFSADRQQVTCLAPAVQFWDNSALNASGATWSWSFPGGSPITSTIRNPLVTYGTPGVYTVSLTVTDVNGTSSKTINSFITVGSSGATTPLLADAEDQAAAPAGWSLQNPDALDTWGNVAVAVASNGGAGRAWRLDNYYYQAPGQEDRLVTPVVTLAGSAGTHLKFHHAYAPYGGGYDDALRVEISTNCGGNWTQLYYAAGAALGTAPQNGNAWEPSAANQWLLHDIDLSAYDGQSVVIRFVNINDYGNRLYLDNINITNSGLRLALKVMLEGPYDAGTQKMRDDLRVAALIPNAEPYSVAGFVQAADGGGEVLQAGVTSTTGDNAIVDWILVELRSNGNPTNIVATRAALVQRDGDVVAEDGMSPIALLTSAGTYRVAVRHRNHLGCMTSVGIALSTTATALDFTNGSVVTYGTNAQAINGTKRLLWTGNAVRDNVLKYTGTNNDRDPILTRVGGTVPTATAIGYHPEDHTLDGVVKYTGTNNDRDPILVNIGGSVPTATRTEQLP
ncbi:MAG: PKD domain-containing protein, partial [Flavobacteriales bacterium]